MKTFALVLLILDVVTFLIVLTLYVLKRGDVRNYLRQEFLLIDNKFALRLGISSNSDLSLSSAVAHAHYFPGVAPNKIAFILEEIIDYVSLKLFNDVDHIEKAFEPCEANHEPLFPLYKIVDEHEYNNEMHKILKLNKGGR